MSELQVRLPVSPLVLTGSVMAHIFTLRGHGMVSAGAQRRPEVGYVIMVGCNGPDGKTRGRGTIDGAPCDLYRMYLADQPLLTLQCGAVVKFMVTQLTVTRHAPPFCEIVTIGELPDFCPVDSALPAPSRL